MANFDAFGVIQPLSLLSAPQASYYFLPDIKIGNGIDITRLPFSIKILLESALRHCDGYQIREQDVLRVAGWQAYESPSNPLGWCYRILPVFLP